MVYPLLVLLTATAMSIGMFWMSHEVASLVGTAADWNSGSNPVWMEMCRWAPPILLILVTLFALVAMALPGWRLRLRWRVPGFREAGVARVADSLAMLLRAGCPLGESLALVRELEGDSPAGAELAQWHEKLSQGEGKPSQFAEPGKVFPPLFTWVIASSGEDLQAGFARAAEIYHIRKESQIETILYAALPTAILLLGVLIVLQVVPLFMLNVRMLDWLSF